MKNINFGVVLYFSNILISIGRIFGVDHIKCDLLHINIIMWLTSANLGLHTIFQETA